jgi:hypothetical protein
MTVMSDMALLLVVMPAGVAGLEGVTNGRLRNRQPTSQLAHAAYVNCRGGRAAPGPRLVAQLDDLGRRVDEVDPADGDDLGLRPGEPVAHDRDGLGRVDVAAVDQVRDTADPALLGRVDREPLAVVQVDRP